MHVLFVTENRFDRLSSGDGSTRYRCFNVAEALIASGHRATVASLGEVQLRFLGQYDVISVLRPRAGGRLKRLVRAARAKGIHLVADFDDLIFDVTAASQSPLVLNGFAEEQSVARGFHRFATAAETFDEITVSTEPLAVAAKQCFPEHSVYVLPNGLSPLWLTSADSQIDTTDTLNGEFQALSYLPGTRSHDADFRMIQTAVADWLAADTDRTLRIVGELNFDNDIADSHQLVSEPLVPYFRLPEKIRTSGVTLAPLLPNRFNEAKSHIKFLESAAFGVPVVATANADIAQHRRISGLYCPANQEKWYETFELASVAASDAGVCTALKNYVRTQWTSVQTSKAAIERWQRSSRSNVRQCAFTLNTADDPERFFLSLRPVPLVFSGGGWQADLTTHIILFESASAEQFEELDFDSIKQQVIGTGLAGDQWLVLVDSELPKQLCAKWQSILREWRPQAAHTGVLSSYSFADRCSLLFQSDVIIRVTPKTAQKATRRHGRTQTLSERFAVSVDRWSRKARKFRESPRRFFADSQIVRLTGMRWH